MKTFSSVLIKINSLLKEKGHDFAIAGGLVASIYRGSPRATADIDIVLLVDKGEVLAKKIIKEFGLKARMLRKADLEGGPQFAIKKKSGPIYMVLGRGDKGEIGLDFILAEMPWVIEACNRAKNNIIDFGFAKLPCLTREDFIISKLYSFNNQKTRFIDLEDIKCVFENHQDLDLVYLSRRMKELGLVMPKELKDIAPAKIFRLINQ